MVSCHCRLLLQHDLMELSVRRLNNSLSTNKERLHAHSQVHTQTPKKEKKKQSKKTKTKTNPPPKPHNGDGLSKFPFLLALSVSVSLLNTRTQTVAHAGTQGKRRKNRKAKAHMSKKVLARAETGKRWTRKRSEHVQRNRQLEKHTSPAAPPPREEMSARNTVAASSSTGVIRALYRRSRQTKYYCHLCTSSSMEINPNKCNERFTKYLAD